MDNAAGIATMLEAARAMVAAGTRPKRSILFAAVTAEEDGLLGAQYLAKHPVVGNGKVVGVVNLDMPILTYDFQDVVAFGAEHSTLGPIIERAAAGANVKLSPDPDPEQSNFVRSDHYRFVQEGVPSVFLVTGSGGAGQGGRRGVHRQALSPRQRPDRPAVQLGRRRQVRADQLSDRARDRRRPASAALVRRTASSATPSPRMRPKRRPEPLVLPMSNTISPPQPKG